MLFEEIEIETLEFEGKRLKASRRNEGEGEGGRERINTK